jgi:predicted DNA-binding transcriptional regulator AlpA
MRQGVHMENKILIRLSELKNILGGVNRLTISRWEESRGFPRRIRLNSRHNVWILKEVENWIQEQHDAVLRGTRDPH